ncbi:hypothetical protein MKW92_024722, partial [Papaver armeniacum]
SVPHVPRNPARDFEEYCEQLNQARVTEPDVAVGRGRGRGRTTGITAGRGGRGGGIT